MGNSVSSTNAQKLFKNTFTAFRNNDYSVLVLTFKGTIACIIKGRFSVSTGHFMISSNLKVRKDSRIYNKILISKTDMKIDRNKNINIAVVCHKNLLVNLLEA